MTTRALARRKRVSRRDRDEVRSLVRLDSWVSALAGMNTARDKRAYTHFVAPHTNWVENTDLWRGDDLAGRIVEMIPNEMFRQGWDLCVEGEGGHEISRRVKSFIEDLGANDKLRHALCQERALGGSGVVMGTSDLGEDMSQPLDLTKFVKLHWLETFEPMELQVSHWQNDPELPGFGRPDRYRLLPVSPGGAKRGMGAEIHVSRILVFPGILVSRRQITSQSGWGDAVLSRCRETLADFQTAWHAAGSLVANFSVPVWKIKGLAELIALDRDDELKSRIEMMALAQSVVNATVIDGELEEFERKTIPITGLPELLTQFATRLAASADTPVTKLMGMSPAGLNATGDSDVRNFYDHVKGMQDSKLRPALEKLIRVAFKSLEMPEPKDWYVEFHPLWQPTEQEQAQARNTQMQVDKGYVEMKVVTPDEVRAARFGGRKFSFGLQVSGPAPVSSPAAAAPGASAPETTEASPATSPIPGADPATTQAAAAAVATGTAFNGAQIAAAAALMTSIKAGQLDPDAAAMMLTQFLGVPREVARAMVDAQHRSPALAAAVA